MKDKNPEFAKIRWQCRRGMLELDRLLLNFFEANFNHFTNREQRAFVQILNCEDQSLYAWLVKKETPSLEDLKKISTDVDPVSDPESNSAFTLIQTLLIKIREQAWKEPTFI